MLKIIGAIGHGDDSEMFCKRPYLGCTFSISCPGDECNWSTEIKSGYPDWFYLFCPEVNKHAANSIMMVCGDCGIEFEEFFTIKMEIEVEHTEF